MKLRVDVNPHLRPQTSQCHLLREHSGVKLNQNNEMLNSHGHYILLTKNVNFVRLQYFDGNLGRLPLVRTGRPDQSICKENSTFNQNCPARSFYFYIVCIAVMSFERKLSKEAYFIFKMTASTAQFGLLVSTLSLNHPDPHDIEQNLIKQSRVHFTNT